MSLSEEELLSRLETLLDWDIRPGVAAHGGSVTLAGVRDGWMEVRLSGACDGCNSKAETLRYGIEARVLRSFPDLHGVREV